MSTIAQIEAVLSSLSAEELVQVEKAVKKAVHIQFRQRGSGLIYDDTQGVETEADLITFADAAFQTYDQAEAKNAK
jgi:hypothetical protein